MGNVSRDVYQNLLQKVPVVQTAAMNVTERLMPYTTREAATNLVREWQEESIPKDTDFFLKHAKSLAPKTVMGWILTSGLGSLVISMATLAFVSTLCISVLGIGLGLTLLVIGGISIATVLSLFTMVLIGSAFFMSILGGTILVTFGPPYLFYHFTRGAFDSVFGVKSYRPVSMEASISSSHGAAASRWENRENHETRKGE